MDRLNLEEKVARQARVAVGRFELEKMPVGRFGAYAPTFRSAKKRLPPASRASCVQKVSKTKPRGPLESTKASRNGTKQSQFRRDRRTRRTQGVGWLARRPRPRRSGLVGFAEANGVESRKKHLKTRNEPTISFRISKMVAGRCRFSLCNCLIKS